MSRELGYDKDGNIVVFDENGNIVGRINDSITERIEKDSKQDKNTKDNKFTKFQKGE